MSEPYKIGEMLSSFPVCDLVKAIENIDRFDEVVPKSRKDEIDVIEKVNEISEKIIGDNL